MGNATHAMGTKLKKSSDYVAEITEINGIELTADTIETTTLASPDNYREFIQGLKDGGEVQISGNFYSGDTNGQIALKADFDAGIVDDYTIEFPTSMGATWTFNGFPTQFKAGDAATEDPVKFEATIKITGKPTLNLTNSTGLSNLVVTTATLSPSFANGTYEYYSSVANGTASVTVTPTAAAHTITVNGSTVTSGQASSAIALTAGAINTITIVAQESGKIAKTYTVKIYRAT